MKNVVVGYKLGCHFNDSYMFPDDMAESIRRKARIRLMEFHSGEVASLPTVTDDDIRSNKCPFCGYRLNFQPHNDRYVPGSKALDIGVTYDGQIIVSAAFKEFCERNRLPEIVFLGFESDKNLHQMIVTRGVPFDSVRRETRFEYLCPVCKNYESIVGAKPSYLLVTEPLAFGFFRSDLVFASGNEKHPLIFVSNDLKDMLEESNLIGPEFSPAFGL